MKTASSTTPSKAKAVCTSAGESSTWDQRARTQAPMGGMLAPATAAAT